MNTTGVIAFAVGAVLMYAAVKDKDPRDVVLTALGQKARYGSASGSSKDGSFQNTFKPGTGAIGSAAVIVPAQGDRTKN